MTLEAGLTATFNVSLHCPLLSSPDSKAVLGQLATFEAHELDAAVALLDEQTPIKKLFMLLEMARHGGEEKVADGSKIALERWITCMEDLAG